jgi:hypothetical protein
MLHGPQLELQGRVPGPGDRVVQRGAWPAHRLADAQAAAGGADQPCGVLGGFNWSSQYLDLEVCCDDQLNPPFFLLLVIVAIVLGIVGVVAKGLLYLMFIGIVVFLAALIFAALRMRRRPGRRAAR